MLKEQELPFKSTKIIDYPGFRQSTKFSCGVAATQSALIFCLGSKYDVPESELFKSLHTTESGGTDPQAISSFLKKKGIKVSLETLSINDLKSNVEKNIPTIVCIQAWGKQKDYSNVYKEGHYVTVIGYNNDGFIFEDPSISARYGFIKYKDLDDRWHDIDKNGNKYDHVGIVIKCNKKYSPEKMEVIEGVKMNLLENYLDFLYTDIRGQAKEWRGPNIPYGDDSNRPNLIRKCFTFESNRQKINCLRKLRDQAVMNPFYQARLDRFVDAITGIYEPTNQQGTIPENEFKHSNVGEDL